MPKLRHIAPSGTPITLIDLGSWIVDSITGKTRTETLKAAICSKYDVRHCFMMSSARAAMAMLFTLLKKNTDDPERNEVIMPSYTCYSVPAAAEIASLKVRICDIDPRTLSYDLDELDSVDLSKVLAIVSANLYGNPDDLKSLESIAKKHGVVFIDDSAQSMHAMQDNRYAGTFGDIGLYSLDKGKNITSIQGGIIVTDDDHLARLIEQEIYSLPEPSFSQKISEALKLIIYSILLHPWLYWIPANIPALGLGKTIYTTDYLFTRYSDHLASISWRLFSRITKITSVRNRNAEKIREVLEDMPGLYFIDCPDDVSTTSLRLPIIIEDTNNRARLIQTLNSSGIGATASYPCSISELEQVKAFSKIHNGHSSGGEYVASHIMTLPTTPGMNRQDIRTIRNTFDKILVKKL